MGLFGVDDHPAVPGFGDAIRRWHRRVVLGVTGGRDNGGRYAATDQRGAHRIGALERQFEVVGGRAGTVRVTGQGQRSHVGLTNVRDNVVYRSLSGGCEARAVEVEVYDERR